MSVEVKIPAVGESITSGVVSVWHKKSGDYVQAGDALFTLETDKVSTEITAEKAGVLETRAKEGQEVKIGEIVAIIDESKGAPEAGAKKEVAIDESTPIFKTIDLRSPGGMEQVKVYVSQAAVASLPHLVESVGAA